jgi:hypothetical protein
MNIVCAEIPNSKFQIPNPKQIPSTKFQRGTKAPPGAARGPLAGFGIWNLELVWNLGFGIWDFLTQCLRPPGR